MTASQKARSQFMRPPVKKLLNDRLLTRAIRNIMVIMVATLTSPIKIIAARPILWISS